MTLGLGLRPKGERPFYPSRFGPSLYFIDAEPEGAAHTYGSTLRSTGGSQPVLTLSGAQTVFMPLALHVECTLGGVRGTWQYKVSYDGGQNFALNGVVSSASSQALTGIAAGLFLDIAVATATLGNIWHITLSAVASQKAVTDTFVQATVAKQPRLVSGTFGINNRPALRADGTDDTLINSTIFTPCSTSGYFFWGVVRFETPSPTGFETLVTGNVAGQYRNSIYQTGFLSTKISQANSAGTVNQIVIGTAPTAVRRIAAWFTTAGAAGCYLQWGGPSDGSSGRVSGGAVGGSLDTTGISLFSRFDSASTFWAVTLGACGGWLFPGVTPPSTAFLTRLDNWGVARYGSGILS